jgi:hypothetical protein
MSNLNIKIKLFAEAADEVIHDGRVFRRSLVSGIGSYLAIEYLTPSDSKSVSLTIFTTALILLCFAAQVIAASLPLYLQRLPQLPPFTHRL